MTEKQVYHHTAEIPGRAHVNEFSFDPNPPEFLTKLQEEKEVIMQRYSDFLWSLPTVRRRELLNRGIFPPQNKWIIDTYRVNEPKKLRNSTGIRKARMEARVMKKAPLFADELIERETEAKPDYFDGTSELDQRRQNAYRKQVEAYESAVRSASDE